MSASVATVHDGAAITVESNGRRLGGEVHKTGDWSEFRVIDLGQIEFQQAGEQVVNVRAKDAQAWKAINLRFLNLTRQASEVTGQ